MSSVNEPWAIDKEYTRYTLLFVYACIIYSIIGFSWGALMGGIPEIRQFVHGRAGMGGELIVRAHTHVNLLGWVEMAIFGAVYYFIPRLVRREIHSLRLVKVHFWIHNTGLLGMVIMFTTAGIISGTQSLLHAPDEVEKMIRPLMGALGIFGSLVLLANMIWGYNIFRTCMGWEKDPGWGRKG
ncbi:MAG: cbb3-type cytochrome c oxidase subunit I [Chromatiales bacterium]|jgi:cytochrome c oxidase cbb3-type subunit 1|nr:cbb3-type cytochrome c oxidase subunit I [Chromatiales bacterium]